MPLRHSYTASLLAQVLNIGRLLKCSQSYAEENESLQKQAVAELTRRTQQLETAVSSGDQRQQQWETAQDNALQVSTIASICKCQRSHASQRQMFNLVPANEACISNVKLHRSCRHQASKPGVMRRISVFTLLHAVCLAPACTSFSIEISDCDSCCICIYFRDVYVYKCFQE